jgi:hydrogenase maturation protease
MTSAGRVAGSEATGGAEASTVLVVGLGSPDRGDDAVGPAVARAVAARGLRGVRVLEHEDPTDLIALWAGCDAVVVVDAVRTGAAAGTVSVLETGSGRPPLPDSAWAGAGRGGTHALGLASAVELARALRRLPERVTVVGVEAAGFAHAAPLSPAVAAAVPRAVAAVVEAAGAAATVRGSAHVSR